MVPHILTFEVGNCVCALPASSVGEILHLSELAIPPGLPPILEGLLNLRGRMVPVVSLRRLIDMRAPLHHLYAPMVVLNTARPLALLVDQLLGLRPLEAAAVSLAPADTFLNDCVASSVRVDGHEIHLLNVERLLLAEEARRIEDLREAAQNRLDRLLDAGGPSLDQQVAPSESP